MTSTPRVRLALVALVSAVGLVVTAFASASAAPTATVPTVRVTIQMFAFTPSNVTAHLGYLVRWTNLDSATHTSTSDQGFWSSPHIVPNANWPRRFNTAGTFPYHCAIHTEMRGRVSVPMRITAQTGGGVLVWSLVSGRFDVQVERPGSHTWVAFRTSTTARSVTFRTSHVGRYLFRARTHGSSAVSGWSPAAALTVR
jgi:plastocyanin